MLDICHFQVVLSSVKKLSKEDTKSIKDVRKACAVHATGAVRKVCTGINRSSPPKRASCVGFPVSWEYLMICTLLLNDCACSNQLR